MKNYGLPAALLRTVCVLFAVGAVLVRDHVALSLALLFVGGAGLLGLEFYFRYQG
ncbi:MAG: hypothetical protein ACRDMH_01080 [Solirubrobacterales bacterium]